MSDQDIAGRWAIIRERIRAACSAVGRDPAEIGVVAVSKKQPPEAVCEAAACGLTIFGENRVQEAAAKIPECPPNIEWHLVGHLQSNKTEPAVEYFQVIHSIDSERLLRRVDAAAGEAGRMVEIFFQVNVAGEASKSGVAPRELESLLEAANECFHVDVLGLMTLPPFHPDPGQTAPHFKALRDLRDRVGPASGFDLPGLSMGMSHDFEVAIAEGSTLIRLGTALLGERPK